MIIIIDNYDSFTYNLVQYFREIEDVKVFPNDEVGREEVANHDPKLIVFSPGPGTPKDSGVCQDILKNYHQTIPMLGVCLGFQLIVEFFGGKVIKGLQPVHGKTAEVLHDQRGVFKNLPSPTIVTRYHSLVADLSKDKNIPLTISSYTRDGVIMGVRHEIYPVEGIQFHPESILTERGKEMLLNSYQQAIHWKEEFLYKAR
ncbi:aminodeoxychorismate/anthranilate synthase component II [Bacillaceae bacterium S4-13-58]